MALLSKLQRIMTAEIGHCLLNEPLWKHCSWQIGGPAALLVEPTTDQQVVALVKAARREELPLVIIGQGSNLLFDDAGVDGIVLKIGQRLAGTRIDGERILTGGGVWVPELAYRAMRAGLGGLEHIIGIPGTLGGLVMMNGGSQRRGIGENVRRVWIVDAVGEERELSREECAFAYRHSALQGTGCVVTRVELECPRRDVRQIRREMAADLRLRRLKFPRKLPNCGSVFLSTAEMHASVGPPGKIIEEAGLKGYRIGQVEVSRQHANFIINLGGASSADILALIRHIRTTIRCRLDFDLCCEVRYVSPQGLVMPAHLAAG